MSDLMFRATSKAAWDAFASASKLTNEDGNPTGCFIDEIGAVVKTPGTYDADGSELTPAVIDARHHVNVRLTDLVSTVTAEDGTVTKTGHDPAELAKGGTDVEWVDPATITTPTRIWAGGMNYYQKAP